MAKSKHRRNHAKRSAERSTAIKAITELQRRKPGVNAAPVHEDGSKIEGMQEIGLNGVKLRGRTKLLTYVDDLLYIDPEVAAKVDGNDVHATLTKAGAVILDEAPPKGSEVSITATMPAQEKS